MHLHAEAIHGELIFDGELIDGQSAVIPARACAANMQMVFQDSYSSLNPPPPPRLPIMRFRGFTARASMAPSAPRLSALAGRYPRQGRPQSRPVRLTLSA